MFAKVVLAASQLLVSSRARAEEPRPSRASETTVPKRDGALWQVVFRLSPPFGGIIGSPGWSSYFLFPVGGSLSLRSPYAIEAEAGGQGWASANYQGTAFVTRIGVGVVLVRGPSAQVRIPVLTVYSSTSIEGSAEGQKHHFDLLGVATGLDLDLGWLNLRLLPFYGGVWQRRGQFADLGETTTDMAGGVTFELGVVFRPSETVRSR